MILSLPTVAEAGFAAIWWIPLFAAVERAPFWMTAWLNRNRQTGSNRAVVRIIEWPGRVPKKGNYLQLDFDPYQPVDRELLVADVRAVWRSSPACAAMLGLPFVFGGLLLPGQSWMLVTAFGVALRLAWELYWAGLLRDEPAVLVRDLCLEAFGRATREQTPIWEWHPANLDLVRMPKDGSRAEATAASLFWWHAFTTGDMESAARAIDRRLELLLPEAGPLDCYFTLGDALFYYAVAEPDPSRSRALATRIQQIEWDLPARQDYIEAAWALAQDRRDDARAICAAGLRRLGTERGSAAMQLERRLLSQCQSRL